MSAYVLNLKHVFYSVACVCASVRIRQVCACKYVCMLWLLRVLRVNRGGGGGYRYSCIYACQHTHSSLMFSICSVFCLIGKVLTGGTCICMCISVCVSGHCVHFCVFDIYPASFCLCIQKLKQGHFPNYPVKLFFFECEAAYSIRSLHSSQIFTRLRTQEREHE